MQLALVTPPEMAPVSLAEAKGFMHVDYDDDDAQIEGMIRAATSKLDGEHGLLGRSLLSTKWRGTLEIFPREIVLPLSPVISVDRISYLAADGEEVDLLSSAYRVRGLASASGVRIRAAAGTDWPRQWTQSDGWNYAFVEFTAGYGTSPDDVPEPLRHAIKMHVAHLYEHRESVTSGSGFISTTPHGYEDLIRDYRAWVF